MKKLILSSITLLMFASSILIFEISCKKNLEAAPVMATQQNKIFFVKNTNNVPGIWTSNYDGTNATNLNVILSGAQVDGLASISPDAKTLFFFAVNFSKGPNEDGYKGIWACNMDGSNAHQVQRGLLLNECLAY